MIKNYSLVFIAFLCFSLSGFGQVTIAQQDFETTPAAPVMTFTGGSVATGTGPFPSGQDNFVSGSQGRKVTNATTTIEFSNVNTSSYTDVDFSVKLASFGGSSGNGADGSDYVIVEVSDDGGSTWTQQAEVNGSGNALWHFGQGSTESNTYNASGYYTSVTGGDGTSGINEIIITDLPSVANLRIRILFENNSGNETWIIDDAKIEGVSASTDTELNFASATYSTSEGDGSINLCVDITNPSASTATTAQVVLTSGTAPHLSYITQIITFPANTSGQQCATVNLADNTNCFDATDYTFEIQSVSGGDSATFGTQNVTTLEISDDDTSAGAFKTLSFEGSDNFVYTGGGTISTTTNKYFGTSSYRLTGSNNLTTENVDISAFTNVTLNVAFASSGADTNEDLYLDISYDNGTTWIGTGSEQLVDGYSNANINMGNTNAYNPTTVSTNPWIVNIADLETQIRVRLRAVGLDGSEYYYVDDIILSGDSCLCSAPADPIGSISGTTPACASTTLTYSGTPAAGTVNYWQTSPTGTDETYNATATYTATTSGTYYVRAYDTAGTCWSDNALSYAVVIENGVPTLTQPTNQTEVIPDTATFSVSSSDTDTYQWEVNTGSGWTDVTGGSGATTDTYTTAATSSPMDGNQYRCILTNICGDTTSNAVTLNLSNDTPNNARNIEACLAETSISLEWDASTGSPSPTGYIVFAQPGSTVPTSTAAAAGDASTYTANTNYTLATTYGTLGKVVYKGNSTNTTVTGLTSGNDYTFKVVAYYSEDLTGWATGINITGSFNDTFTIGMPTATLTGASVAPTSSVLTWTNPLPTSCYEILIVANQGSTTFTPVDGTTYTANATYSGSNSIVFMGNGITTTVNGLTDAVEYCYTIFVRSVATGEWSAGDSVCQTTGLSYCTSEGGSSTDSGIVNVSLNTIDQDSDSDDAYTDFTSVSTDLTLGETYPLSVNVNTGGNYTSYVKVWIDWDRDGSFNSSSNEAIELGTIDNDSDGQPSLSPINITVPSSATVGNVRMRVSSNSDSSDNDYATSCQSFGYGEVEDYIINIVRPIGAEIHVEGNNNTILNGDITTSGLNNTSFGTTSIGSTIVKTFTIESIGASALNLTGSPDIQITGTHASDFVVTTQPSSSSLSSGQQTDFVITFTPSGSNIRTASVVIPTNDSDENPFTFAIQGNGECNPATYEMSPSSGPAGTVVTVTTTSGSDADSATALYDGIAATVTYISSSEFQIRIPDTAISANITFDDVTGCARDLPFTVITSDISSCDGLGVLPTDIFISEVTDRDSSVDGHSYVELYNGTGAAVDISDYSIEVHSNGNSFVAGYINIPNGTTLADGDTYVASFGTGSNNVDPVSQHDYFSSNTTGINDSDHLILNDGSTDIDLWGDTSGDPFTGGVGSDYSDGTPNGSDYTYRRLYSGTTLPSMTWNPADWTLITPLNYSDIGNYDFSIGTAPTVTVQPADSDFNCEFSASFTIAGMEGSDESGDTQELAYQWYYNAPGNTAWTEITAGNTDYSGQQSPTLTIANSFNLNGYQYYCQLREDDATCYKASNAVSLEVLVSTWDGTWSADPTIDSFVILDEDYDTAVGGTQISFEACSCEITTGNELIISDNTYVKVENNLVVDGSIAVQPYGAFVQVNDAGTVTGNVLSNKTKIQVYKKTPWLESRHEYVYWSAPVSGETIGDGLAEANTGRRYTYLGQNFLDATAETNNNGAAVAGQDDVDDDNNDWLYVNGATIMQPGVGYAATQNNITPFPTQIDYIFEGPFNNGVYNIPIYRNDSETNDNNWNLIGNPYPSAIDAEAFLLANATIGETTGPLAGAIFFWSHATEAASDENGNQGLNYAQSDYAIINGSGQTAGGDNVMPEKFIPSGQAFFVSMDDGVTPTTVSGNIKSTEVIFNNSMRVTGDNTQFFRSETADEPNRLWLNLNTDNGVTNQTLVAYVNGATDDFDGTYYDAKKNVSTDVSAVIYSVLENAEVEKLAIQGRNPNSLTLDEVIPLGFITGIDVPTLYSISIYQFEGAFMTENAVYINDKLLNTFHNLKDSDYTFTSETGEFNDRFEIVFTPTTLSIDDNIVEANEVTITELQNGDVQFKVGNNHTIKHVAIIDVTGRIIYSLQGNDAIEVYHLSKLSQAAYIAKITLSNGQVISKKAIKQH
ncbi:GEVED domain-containing protein [Winogradskyella helgolandensis]|uniref:GEVED domain-containing protein n=1 Tax=Winogradskyella helgolandensis TaxID=2697010 RepID=UPI0015CAA63A|nr:GEVED domain-containing protein [Winogradskyella helgolandensis]